ncbi:hypothetical protein ANANG_G00195670 [Anguilla anguilla]|uniref:Regulator of chromosome condensation 1/beta-lactamase-inhibitor protein II n=1 Tax=Anguilla anguilla TaxID=7936 RepID=A0A9D3M1X0_ANGAN|nr:hypothetical protein ANANG_G00195670 [Anguilla anguilla]
MFAGALSSSGPPEFRANDYGQIGSRSCEDAAVPRFVEDLENITSIACGANHNLALSGNGKVFQWGCGRACGNLRRNLPVPEEVPLPPVSVNAVRGGCWHSLLLTEDFKVTLLAMLTNARVVSADKCPGSSPPTPTPTPLPAAYTNAFPSPPVNLGRWRSSGGRGFNPALPPSILPAAALFTVPF